jgi:hypothetical protein
MPSVACVNLCPDTLAVRSGWVKSRDAAGGGDEESHRDVSHARDKKPTREATIAFNRDAETAPIRPLK